MSAPSGTTPAGSAEVAADPRPFGGATSRPPKRRRRTGPSRRDFLRTGLLASVVGVVASFGGASLAFLWPSLRGGFGARLEVGSAEAVAEELAANQHMAFPAGRAYLVAYDAAQDPDGMYAEITGGSPFMALYHKCVHLGCRVPWCASSSWFECPCHGSRYNVWGEYEFGPAPRGLDRFSVAVEEGRVFIDTSTIVTGPPRSSGTLSQPPAGPHCTG